MRFWKSVLGWGKVSKPHNRTIFCYYPKQICFHKKVLNISMLRLSSTQSPFQEIKQGALWIFPYLWTEVSLLNCSKKGRKSQTLSKFQMGSFWKSYPLALLRGKGEIHYQHFHTFDSLFLQRKPQRWTTKVASCKQEPVKYQLSLLYGFWCVNNVSLWCWQKPSSLLLYCGLQGLIGIK